MHKTTFLVYSFIASQIKREFKQTIQKSFSQLNAKTSNKQNLHNFFPSLQVKFQILPVALHHNLNNFSPFSTSFFWQSRVFCKSFVMVHSKAKLAMVIFRSQCWGLTDWPVLLRIGPPALSLCRWLEIFPAPLLRLRQKCQTDFCSQEIQTGAKC